MRRARTRVYFVHPKKPGHKDSILDLDMSIRVFARAADDRLPRRVDILLMPVPPSITNRPDKYSQVLLLLGTTSRAPTYGDHRASYVHPLHEEQQHYWSDDPLINKQGFSLLCRKRIKDPYTHSPPIPHTALHVP